MESGYFVPVLIQAYSGRKETLASPEFKNQEKNSLVMFMVIPLLITAVISVLIGCFPGIALTLIQLVVK